jgi:hypothetical protein
MTLEVSGTPKSNRRSNGFDFLWAKHVSGINPTQHCFACLVGPKERMIKRGMVDGIYPIHMLAPFFYICGVAPFSAPHRSPERAASLGRNFHFAIQYQSGAQAIADTFNGIRFVAHDAVRIPITPLPLGWKGLGVEFTTCRNFQFAVEQFGYDLTEKPKKVSPQGSLY